MWHVGKSVEPCSLGQTLVLASRQISDQCPICRRKSRSCCHRDDEADVSLSKACVQCRHQVLIGCPWSMVASIGQFMTSEPSASSMGDLEELHLDTLRLIVQILLADEDSSCGPLRLTCRGLRTLTDSLVQRINLRHADGEEATALLTKYSGLAGLLWHVLWQCNRAFPTTCAGPTGHTRASMHSA